MCRSMSTSSNSGTICFAGNAEPNTIRLVGGMSGIASTGRRLLLIVALFATMQALLHSHSIADSYTDHASAPAQSCALCISTAASLLTAAIHLSPPVVTDRRATPPSVPLGSPFSALALPPRAPPQL